METRIHEFRYENGEIQRVQEVSAPSFKDLSFFHPSYSKDSFERLCALYRDYICVKYGSLLGKIVLFQIPDDLLSSFGEDEDYGSVFDPLAFLCMRFRKRCHLKKGKIVFDDSETEELFYSLKEKGSLFLAQGKRNTLSFLPVSKKMGFLSKCLPNASLKVNAGFFVMDLFDCATPFDAIGTPVGFAAQNGNVLSPPLYGREVFLVGRDGKTKIADLPISDIPVWIDGKEYRNGENALFVSRPDRRRSFRGGFDIIIVDNKVVALKEGGGSAVPASGFVMHLKEKIDIKDRNVSYGRMEDVLFGLQAGNSVMRDHIKTEKFISPFYHVFRPFSISFPPSLYPLDFKKARAPRIVLGSDDEGEMKLFWFEGAGKFGYRAGVDSCGASLKEVSDICEELGLKDGIHLDGGGSAQILINGKRQLMLSDRDPDTYEEIERAVPLGLYI